MIRRYSRPEMANLWLEQNRYLVWLQVEVEVCRELARAKVIPQTDWRKLEKKTKALLRAGGVSAKRVEYFESKTRHDIIAFTTAVAEKVGAEGRFVHFGLTSSDVVDTALSVVLQQAGKLLLKDVESLKKSLKKKARQYQKLPTIGRSHGIWAEPTSFGLKFLSWYSEWDRNEKRLREALEGARYGKLSGSVGVNSHWGPSFEKKTLKALGLKREPVSTQVLPRDRHAQLLQVFALCGASIERISVELRHLQRSEVSEVREGFRKGQKGSSAMPHKRNPISTENLTGCARLLRAYAQTGLENIPLWHERDISHSSVERISFPDSTILLDYALSRLTGVIDQLVVNQDRVKENLKKAGATVYSGHILLELVKKGASREEAYYWIQECAIQEIEGKGKFLEELSKHPKITKYLKPSQIEKLGSLAYQLRNVDQIYREVFGKG